MRRLKPETTVQDSSLAEITQIRRDAPTADQRHKKMRKQTRRTNVLTENRIPRFSAKARSAQNTDACLREPGKTICQRTENFRKKSKISDGRTTHPTGCG